MRPVKRLAVNILFEQALAHHEPEILAGAAPGRVRGLVDDVAKIIETAGIGGLSSGKPGLAGLAALPGAGGKSQDFNLDPAAFQRARENVGAGRGNRDRTAAHRP